jgi:tetratricopeptide (TPR) repeat protein
VARDAIGMLLTYVGFMRPETTNDLEAALARLGPPSTPWARGIHAQYVEADGPTDRVQSVLRLTESDDRATALMGWQWAAVLAENLGDIDDAATYIRAALSALDEGTTPWQVATLHTQEAMLALQRGEHRAAAEHARVARPLLTRLRADDDAMTVGMVIALAAILEGDLESAARIIDEAGQDTQIVAFGGGAMLMAARAELALARGEWETGLAVYDEAVDAMRGVSFSGVPMSGLEPWVLVSLSTALAGHVRYGTTEKQAARAAELAAEILERLQSLLVHNTDFVDYPVTGMGFAVLGAFLLDRGGDAEAGVHLLALAHRYGYNHAYPVMAWEPMAELAETALPGRLDEVLTKYGDRRGRDLLAETVAVLQSVDLTFCG